MSTASTSSPPARASFTTSTSSRPARPRQFQFAESFGQRYHTYDSGKAPYPLSYDRPLLETEALDNQLVKHLRQGSVSYANFPDSQPEHCLDLGCGIGSWILEAAKEWPACEFVGFDLVDVQLPTHFLDLDKRNRISFKHGNFLTTRLPFDDDEFDHVHVQYIAKAVPENKWDFVFDEITRVLCPGGTIEIIEEDVIFPRLPRWFTASLKRPSRKGASVQYPDGTQRSGSFVLPHEPVFEQSSDITHEHALLESLYMSVFHNRFINTRPLAVLPSYMTTYFRSITLGPIICFPMPPIPPPQPLPIAPAARNTMMLADNNVRASIVLTRPTGVSFSSTTSAATTDTLFTRPRVESNSSVFEDREDDDDLPPSSKPAPPRKRYILENALGKTATASIPPQLFAIEQLESLSERSLAMHLFRSYQTVIACREALWQELASRMMTSAQELESQFGWISSEDKGQNMESFERLLTRYESDMKMRVALWCSLSARGWTVPTREVLSKAELIEEERIRERMLEARRFADPEDLQLPSRTMRILVGHKP